MPSLERFASLPAPSLRPGPLVVTRGTAVYRAAADEHHIVWETGPVEEEDVPTSLLQRDLDSGRTTRLARNIYPAYGVASTRRWVVYAEGNGANLVAVTHDGSRRTVLSSSLVAPIAARGELVAWAEQQRQTQRVIVRNFATGQEWVAAKMSRCNHGRCYQIGAVTLAGSGVVFTRTASGPDVSFIARRAFDAPRVSAVKVPGDPQPELVPSSAGAVYFALDRGWYRWDFGRAQPQRMSFAANPPAQLLTHEGGRWFVLTRRGCRSGVASVEQPGRRSILTAPSTVVRSALRSTPKGICVDLGSLVSTARQPLTAWAVAPEESEEEHEDVGVAGVVYAAARLP
jgi:hypothetical protein